VRVKVDGEELELPLSVVTKGYQKDSTASRRLEQAAAERQDLEARKRELDNREAILKSVDQSSPIEVGDIDAQIKATVAAIVEGDEEGAAETLKKLIGHGRQETTRTPTIDEDAIIAKTKTQLRNEEAWDAFISSNTAFADVHSKERQYGDYLFDKVYAPLMKSGELSYREALEKTADDVNKAFAAPPPPPTPRQQKEERKQRIDNLPVAAGARAVTETAKTETTQQALDRMRAWRGQPV
jgi:hypothetical protein